MRQRRRPPDPVGHGRHRRAIHGRWPITGRSLDDCDLVSGDEHDGVVSLGATETLAALVGKPVRLVVELKDADLYAIRFAR